MVTRKPYHALLKHMRLRSTVWLAAGCAASLMSVSLFVYGYGWHTQSAPASLTPSSGSATSVSKPQPQITDLSVPNVLSRQDADAYRAVFQAQKTADWENADRYLKQVSNPLLLGHVLANRYLNRHYTSTVDELAQWLEKYSDLPQAQRIHALALRKAPDSKLQLAEPHNRQSLNSYGDDQGLAHAGNETAATLWEAGLNAWRQDNKAEAAKLFATLADQHQPLSSWGSSAASYWAYRAHAAIGQKTEARRFLRMAAKEPRSFYGIIARKHLGWELNLDTTAPSLTDSEILEVIGEAIVRRTVALTQIDEYELAESELRFYFPQADMTEKLRLLALASELNLAAVQISMARQLSTEGRKLDMALYPVPDWKPQGGFTIAPELLFALMRQESGFRPSAVSSVGALGLMQLMPQTASLMQKRMNHTGNVAEPVVNITLGQNYVEHLLNNGLVDGNLIYLLTAYNAGPGRLQSWKQSISQEDPLLFIESIPFAQTRSYVMQVMTNYWIYSELTGTPNADTFALADGKWPKFEQPSTRMVSNNQHM